MGKTTTAVNLAASLSMAGKRTLLLDFDPQGNASSGVGFPKTSAQSNRGQSKPVGVLSAALASQGLQQFVQPTQLPGLSVLPSSPDCSSLELIQEVQERGIPKFREQVSAVSSAFDYVLIDCPPSLGGLPTIALSVSHRVLVPIQCEYYAMEGLSQILPIIHKLKQSINTVLEIEGLLLTMFACDLDLSVEVVREISDYFSDSVFQTIIPRDVVLAEAASHGVPAFEYAPLSRGAWSYLELAKEVLSHDWS